MYKAIREVVNNPLPKTPLPGTMSQANCFQGDADVFVFGGCNEFSFAFDASLFEERVVVNVRKAMVVFILKKTVGNFGPMFCFVFIQSPGKPGNQKPIEPPPSIPTQFLTSGRNGDRISSHK